MSAIYRLKKGTTPPKLTTYFSKSRDKRDLVTRETRGPHPTQEVCSIQRECRRSKLAGANLEALKEDRGNFIATYLLDLTGLFRCRDYYSKKSRISDAAGVDTNKEACHSFCLAALIPGIPIREIDCFFLTSISRYTLKGTATNQPSKLNGLPWSRC